MATEDFSLIDSPSHDDNPHAHTRHLPSSSADAGDSSNADYFTQPFPDDAEESSDPNKSDLREALTPCSKRIAAVDISDYSNKKSKPSDLGSEANYRKDREEWGDTAIECLLDVYTEKLSQLSRGNLRGRDWEEVARIVSERCGGGVEGKGKLCKSVEQCKNKIDNLKKRYKVEVQRVNSGSVASSSWHWFKKIEAIVGNSLAVRTVSDDDKAGGATATPLSVVRRPKNRY